MSYTVEERGGRYTADYSVYFSAWRTNDGVNRLPHCLCSSFSLSLPLFPVTALYAAPQRERAPAVSACLTRVSADLRSRISAPLPFP